MTGRGGNHREQMYSKALRRFVWNVMSPKACRKITTVLGACYCVWVFVIATFVRSKDTDKDKWIRISYASISSLHLPTVRDESDRIGPQLIPRLEQWAAGDAAIFEDCPPRWIFVYGLCEQNNKNGGHKGWSIEHGTSLKHQWFYYL